MKHKQLNISHKQRNGSWFANKCKNLPHLSSCALSLHDASRFSRSVKDGVVIVLVSQLLHVQLSLFCRLLSSLSTAASDRPELGGSRVFSLQRYQNTTESLLHRHCSYTSRSQSELEAPVDKRGGSGKLPDGQVSPHLQPFLGPPPFCLYTTHQCHWLNWTYNLTFCPLSTLCIHCERVPAVSSTVAYNLSQTRKTGQ